MGFLDISGLEKMTNQIVKSENIKVVSHRGSTVKKVIDNIERECDNVVSPLEYTIENKTNNFLVGTGINGIDVSQDVENASCIISLKGTTYQNLVDKGLVLADFQLFTDCKESEYNDYFLFTRVTGQLKMAYGLQYRIPFRQNTKYTAILTKRDTVDLEWYVYDPHQEKIISTQTNDLNKIIINTAEDTSGLRMYFNAPNDNSQSFKFFKNSVVILEGDYSKTPIEELPGYFEGIKSSFEDGDVDIISVGKNMFDFNNSSYMVEKGASVIKTNHNGLVVKYTPANNGRLFYNIKLSDIDTTRDLSISMDFKIDSIDGSFGIYLREAGFGKTYSRYVVSESGKWIRAVLNVPKNTIDTDMILILYKNDFNETYSPTLEFKNIQIEYCACTEYEDYITDNIKLNIGEPLRCLPNGLCDEITSDGKLIRRIMKVTCDVYPWTLWYYPNQSQGSNLTINCFCSGITGIAKRANSFTNNQIICNNFIQSYNEFVNRSSECILLNSWDLHFSVFKSKLETPDFKGITKYMRENVPISLVELDTPLITDLKPLSLDVFNKGCIKINSNIPPNSTHTVQLNRTGQIEVAIKSIGELRNRIDVLENFYDVSFLETGHSLELLGHSYALDGGLI